jgi:dTDP-4-amino-4,6-dideoxygalactose transaminase
MRDSGRFVIEDAAHAPGAELHRKRAARSVMLDCLIVYPTKIMTTGEGGMLVTDGKSIGEC